MIGAGLEQNLSEREIALERGCKPHTALEKPEKHAPKGHKAPPHSGKKITMKVSLFFVLIWFLFV